MTIQRSSDWVNSKLTFSIKLLRCSHICVHWSGKVKTSSSRKGRLVDERLGRVCGWGLGGRWGCRWSLHIGQVSRLVRDSDLGDYECMEPFIRPSLPIHFLLDGWGANALDISTHEKLWLIMLGLLLWVICWLVIWELWRQPFIQCSTIHGRDDRSCVI